MTKKVFIGIDPDVDKSGFARWDRIKKDLVIQRLSFFKLYGVLSALDDKTDTVVLIEAGWLNKKANFRQVIKRKGIWIPASQKVKERMASKVGRNEEVGRKIVEMCESIGIEYRLVKPTKRKVTPELFERITQFKTKDQEMIDAAMLVVNY